MGLPAALKAHASKDFATAAQQYQRAIDQKTYKPVLFQNYGALLRELGRDQESKTVYELGLKHFPGNYFIKRNYANLMRELDKLKSLEILFELLHQRFTEYFDDLNDQDFLPIVQVLHALGRHSWAYDICVEAISIVGLTPGLAVECLKSFAYYDTASSSITSGLRKQLEKYFSSKIDSFSALQKAEYFYSLSWMYFQDRSIDCAIDYLFDARRALSSSSELNASQIKQANHLNDLTSWNAATILLNSQKLELGWKLFDHGLRVSAKGPQAWQRALPKLFTNDSIALWRGSNLNSKSLLLLEEQAVGDVMQFLTLLPTLIEEAKHIGLLVNNRLYPIYNRSFAKFILSGKLSLWSFDDIRTKGLDPSSFDFQSPLGSICQYRFTHPGEYSPQSPILTIDSIVTQTLRQNYLNKSLSKTPKKLIGISWRGGGTSARIKQKSIDPDLFLKLLLSMPGYTFVNLQYGKTRIEVSDWQSKGLDLIDDSEYDPIVSMDKWLHQVAVCDAVISVANTTIHGSGGLNIPTMCLLSENYDWRWFTDPLVDRSYWYPSVSIARQTKEDGWTSAFAKVIQWCDTGFTSGGSCAFTV